MVRKRWMRHPCCTFAKRQGYYMLIFLVSVRVDVISIFQMRKLGLREVRPFAETAQTGSCWGTGSFSVSYPQCSSSICSEAFLPVLGGFFHPCQYLPSSSRPHYTSCVLLFAPHVQALLGSLIGSVDVAHFDQAYEMSALSFIPFREGSRSERLLSPLPKQ